MLVEIKPTSKPRIMDLVSEAGIDVSDWKNFNGKHPSANPKYCYNWTFKQPGEMILVCLWWTDILVDGDIASHNHNIRLRDGRAGGAGASNWKKRAREFDENIQDAYRAGLPVRVVVLSGDRRDPSDPDPEAADVEGRLLDPLPWAISSYDYATGECLLTRGALPTGNSDQDAPDFDGFEGEQRRLYVLHRRREASLRRKKLQASMWENAGALKCEVPRCGFDFKQRYGDLGKGFAHVHHLRPLSESPVEGRTVSLKDLAVVCANCHAMIHIGGKCRDMKDLIPFDHLR